MFLTITTKELHKSIRSPLRFPGGKSRTAETILKFFPKFKEYREPMVGGGSVFLLTKVAFPQRKYWINDYNKDLYLFWKACKEAPERLAKAAEDVRNSQKNGKEIFNEWKYSKDNKTDFELAVRFFILNRISFSGLVDAGGFSQEAFEKRFTETSIERLISVRKELKNVKITNLSYEDLLRKAGDEVFIYLDPPYYSNKNSKLYGKKGILHTTFDHKRLAEELENCKFNWLLTCDANDTIKKYYSFANQMEIKVSYGMNNSNPTGKAEKGNELIIYNYKAPKQEELEISPLVNSPLDSVTKLL